jgi:hypothetical protein
MKYFASSGLSSAAAAGIAAPIPKILRMQRANMTNSTQFSLKSASEVVNVAAALLGWEGPAARKPVRGWRASVCATRF